MMNAISCRVVHGHFLLVSEDEANVQTFLLLSPDGVQIGEYKNMIDAIKKAKAIYKLMQSSALEKEAQSLTDELGETEN